jgi:hypothetical protein
MGTIRLQGISNPLLVNMGIVPVLDHYLSEEYLPRPGHMVMIREVVHHPFNPIIGIVISVLREISEISHPVTEIPEIETLEEKDTLLQSLPIDLDTLIREETLHPLHQDTGVHTPNQNMIMRDISLLLLDQLIHLHLAHLDLRADLIIELERLEVEEVVHLLLDPPDHLEEVVHMMIEIEEGIAGIGNSVIPRLKLIGMEVEEVGRVEVEEGVGEEVIRLRGNLGS